MKESRWRAADVVALVAAVALLFAMAADWYSTVDGEEARRIEELSEPEGAEAGEVERATREAGRIAGEEAERNAWQEDGAVDRVILVLLLVAIVLALLAVAMRASGRSGSTSAMGGALAAAAGGVLVTYRIWQEPGIDSFNTVQSGALIAIALSGVLALALVRVLRNEEAATAE